MASVSIRELRNQGGAVIERVRAGERITVTRDGEAVADLVPRPRRGVDAATLLDRWRHLPPIDFDRFRADVDGTIDQSL